jgi:hypothetical protein
LGELVFQPFAQKITKIRVCSECLDVDHPQLMLGRIPINDPIALRDPRPPLDYDPSNYDTSIYIENALGIALQTDSGIPILIEIYDPSIYIEAALGIPLLTDGGAPILIERSA